jgi:hypothetical protein
MRRTALRLSYFLIPIVAIGGFMFVQQQMDGLAPAPPAAIPSQSVPETIPITAPQAQPTILAPEDTAESLAPETDRSNWPTSTIIQSSYDGSTELRPASFRRPSERIDTARAQTGQYLLTDPDQF